MDRILVTPWNSRSGDPTRGPLAGRKERHGKFLQDMISRIDHDHPINTYDDLQVALSQSTHAKNALSIKHGYAPEVIVFGKHSRLPGSILSDESLPSHSHVLQEDQEISPSSFKTMLMIRESARCAFHKSDNCDALRRAILSRSCPSRGQFSRGDSVMIWKSDDHNSHQWIGPHRVIIQDGNTTVWTTQAGRLYRRAPEHVRLATLEETMQEVEASPDWTLLERQIQNMSRQDTIIIPNHELTETPGDNPNPHSQTPSELPEAEQTPMEHIPSNPESVPQPDQEPENPTEASPSSEQMPVETIGLYCQDLEEDVFFSSCQDTAWRCEVEVQLNQPLDQHQPGVEEACALLATSAKKQRTEIKLSTLTSSEKAEFEQAKLAEIQNWVQTGTIARVFRDQIPPSQVLRCRWILTWKPVDPQELAKTNSKKTHRAKARLVVLGYLDPQIENIPRDSPTLNKTARMLILQVIASLGFTLRSFDIRAAFLQGEPQSSRLMAVEPVPEMRKFMGLKSDEVAQLKKGAYGLVDAPFLWFCALQTELHNLGFESSPFCPCTFVLRDPNTQGIAGILGMHVDDGLGGGNQFFQEKIDLLEQKYPFGSKKTSAFTFTGIEMAQRGDHSIVLNQSSYVRKIPAINLEVNRKTLDDEPVTEEERLLLRGLIGSLQYAAVNTRPDISSRLSILQSQINKAKICTIHEANKLLHDAKKFHEVQITIKPIPMQDYRLMAFSDASFASIHKPDSHSGVIIVGTHKNIANNQQCPISPLSWGCKKIQRVVTSTLSAETTALAASLDQLSWIRLFWSWLKDPKTCWKHPEKGLENADPAIAVPTMNHDFAITDCKSLFDLVSKTATPSCSEFRVQLVARAIKETLKENISLRWVHSAAQLADALTKAMEAKFLRETLQLGEYRLFDEDAVLKQRAKTKDRVRWLKQEQNSEKD